MSNHDIEGHVPPESAAKAANTPSGAPDSLEGQLAKEREARQLIRDRLRHTEALAAESHALRAQMAEELERVTADRDRLRAEATIAAAISTDEPAAARAVAPEPEPAPAAADMPRAAPAASVPRAAPAPAPRYARGPEPTMSPTPPPPRASAEHPLGERPLKPPVRRGPWRALAMLGGLAAAVAGLAWLTGTMPSGLDLAASPPAASAPGAGATPAASSPALASASRPAATAVAASSSPSASMLAATPPPRAAVPLPPMAPEARLAAAPTAAGPVATAMAASVAASVAPPSPAAPAAPVQTAARGQSQLQAAGGLDLRLRKALDGEGIAAIVEVDPANGHVLVADPQAERALRDRTDMLIRAVYAGASLPEPQIEHRWLSPMHGDRNEAMQAQAPAPASPAPPTPARAQPQQQQQQQRRDVLALAPPAAGLATKHVQSARAGDRHDAGAGISLANVEELRPVLPSGRFTAGCMEDIAGKTTNRRAALTVCMKHSCCSSSANLNSEECRAYQKAYPYTCSAG